MARETVNRNKPRTPPVRDIADDRPAFSREQLEYLERVFAPPSLDKFRDAGVHIQSELVGQQKLIAHIRQIVNKEL